MERGIIVRKGWLWGVLSLVLCLALVSSAVAPALAEDAEGGCDDCPSYPIMRPDPETLERWIEAYNNAPRAYIDMEGFQVPSPSGSLSLLDHLEYTPAERNQGYCNNCWAWAGTGVMEVALHVQEGTKDRLSVQYINSCEETVIGKTCCTGGWLFELADFYDATDMAIPWSNTNANWQDGDASCNTDCGLISTTPNYPITYIQETTISTQTVDQATAIANIKYVLNQNKAVFFGFLLPNDTAWDDFHAFWVSGSESDVYAIDQFCGQSWVSGEGSGHAVLCVGYNDNVPGNEYWIMLNSWGTAGDNRPNGLFHIDMDMNYSCTNPGLGGGDYSFYWQTLDVTFDIPDQPDITVDPTSFDVTLPPDTTQDYILTISNDGNADLTYSISDRETIGGAGAYEPTQWNTMSVEDMVAPIELQKSARGNPKLESSLNQLLEVHRREGLPAMQAFAERHMMVMEADRVQVVIEVATPEAIGDLREAVEALGGEYQCHYENLLQALVPGDALESLAERPEVQLVREPRRPIPAASVGAGAVVTEGLAASNAAAWHGAGYTGAGVIVAVIDGGFTDYSSLLGTDLPVSVTTYDWTGAGMGSSLHGTACAEIVYDMAPGATMYLHKVGDKVQLGNAVDQTIADDVDVISMSLGWLQDGPGDGTGFLADIVSNARSNGIFYAAAAGNNAEHCWSGTYTDTDSNDLHEWVPGVQDVNYFGPGNGDAYIIPAGYPISVALHWDDWTTVDQDYDMELYYWDGDSWEYVTGSYNYQDGSSYPTPEESIGVYAPYTAPYGVAVSKWSSTRDVCLRLIASHSGYELDERVPERSLIFPADSPDAVTVGAVDVSTYNLEPYSSQGPTLGPGGACDGGSTKPDIAAYAGVSTVSYGPGGFAGTSAATPHVAGAAALVAEYMGLEAPGAEAYLSYTPAEIQSFLEGSAVDLGAAGKDNLYGSGRLYLGSPDGNSPPYAPSDPSPAHQATGVSIDAGLNWTGGDPDLDDTVTYDVYFDTTGATTLVSENQSATTYGPGTLSHNTTYYWKIVAEDNHGATTPGSVWEFTTAEATDCPWLSVNSTSGSVAPSDSHDITVSIDTTGLGSNYTAEIVIASNDPDEDSTVVPVTLHVSEAPPAEPDITVSPTSFNKTLAPYTTQNYTLTIGNDGDAELTYNITDREAMGGGSSLAPTRTPPPPLSPPGNSDADNMRPVGEPDIRLGAQEEYAPHQIFEEGDTLEELRDKIEQNGYNFTVDHNWVYDMSPEEKGNFFGRHDSGLPEGADTSGDIGPLARYLGTRQLPSQFDWRNYNGHSYIGAIRNQEACGSCYAFGACAAAEGTYNLAMGLYDGDCSDFSESFIIWCLGSLPEYKPHFYGCDGADYTYSELTALTVEGVSSEADFPYQTWDGCGDHWDDPRIAFGSWYRIPCGDIDAIKTAIMTYGVVDVAVLTTSAFQAYSGSIYEDTNTDCYEDPCYNTPTNHCVALVGWNDNGDPETNGYWILRNSWGTDWGESGYMRIKYRSAAVACEACYLVYSGGEDCPWLSMSPTSGSVAPAASDEITVTIDTTGLAEGDYTAEIVIVNNDPDENPKIVPVNLQVVLGPTLELVEGVNIIPYTGATTSLPEALTNIAELVEIIWARGIWTGGEWHRFFFYHGFTMEELEELEDGRAYIIVVSEHCIWQLPQ
jgi:C1A family cysteine protease